MIASTGGDMECSRIFVLNIARHGQFLSSEAQLPNSPVYRITGQLGVVCVHSSLVPASSAAFWMRPAATSIRPIVPSS